MYRVARPDAYCYRLFVHKSSHYVIDHCQLTVGIAYNHDQAGLLWLGSQGQHPGRSLGEGLPGSAPRSFVTGRIARVGAQASR